MGILSEILGLGGGTGLTIGAYNRLGDIGDEAQTAGMNIAQESAERSRFVPFGVTSGIGGAMTGPEGSLDLQLSPEQQQLASIQTQGAQSLFGDVLGDRSGREMDVYERIRATQRPEEERQRLGLENRLHSQGRLGVRTSMFGGTPEQLALAKAQEESQNQASLMALQQAQREQAQNATIGSQMLRGSYAPQAALLSQFQPALQTASLADVARRQAANLYGQGAMSGVEARLGAGLGQASFMGQLGTGLLSGVLTPRQLKGGGITNPLGAIEGALSNIPIIGDFF